MLEEQAAQVEEAHQEVGGHLAGQEAREAPPWWGSVVMPSVEGKVTAPVAIAPSLTITPGGGGFGDPPCGREA